jgi:hypothetical protein
MLEGSLAYNAGIKQARNTAIKFPLKEGVSTPTSY